MVWDSSIEGVLHCILNLEDNSFGAVFALGGFVFAVHDGKSVYDVVGSITVNSVKVKIGSIKFATQDKATFFIPKIWCVVVHAVLCETL